MASISPVYFDGNPNHLQQYYLYSPLKRLKDDRAHEIDTTHNYLNNIESKYKSPRKISHNTQNIIAQQSPPRNIDREVKTQGMEIRNVVQTPLRYTTYEGKRRWPKIFDSASLEKLAIQTERIRSISPKKMEFSAGVKTIANKKVEQLDKQYLTEPNTRGTYNSNQIHQSPTRQIYFGQTPPQNKYSVQTQHLGSKNIQKFRASQQSRQSIPLQQVELAQDGNFKSQNLQFLSFYEKPDNQNNFYTQSHH